MTRKPDDVKKGLNDPIPVHFHIGDPEPRLTPLMMVDLEELHADALSLIQQLQDDNAQQARCIENMTDKLNAMNDEVAKLQAERDAAVVCIGKLTVILKTYPYAATNGCAYEAYREIKKYIDTVRGVTKEK